MLEMEDDENQEMDMNGTCWGLSNDGNFSLKSAYNMLRAQMNTSLDDSWSLIWKLKVPLKIQMFI